ncbi:hypothetical protein BJX66DRAFT_291130, partial [Aspergillus keveii]
MLNYRRHRDKLLSRSTHSGSKRLTHGICCTYPVTSSQVSKSHLRITSPIMSTTMLSSLPPERPIPHRTSSHSRTDGRPASPAQTRVSERSLTSLEAYGAG